MLEGTLLVLVREFSWGISNLEVVDKKIDQQNSEERPCEVKLLNQQKLGIVKNECTHPEQKKR